MKKNFRLAQCSAQWLFQLRDTLPWYIPLSNTGIFIVYFVKKIKIIKFKERFIQIRFKEAENKKM